MNSAEYFSLMQQHKSDQYFAKIKMNYVYANPIMMTQSEPYMWMMKNHLTPLGVIGGSTLYSYNP
jgi:hypothetical protein